MLAVWLSLVGYIHLSVIKINMLSDLSGIHIESINV